MKKLNFKKIKMLIVLAGLLFCGIQNNFAMLYFSDSDDETEDVSKESKALTLILEKISKVLQKDLTTLKTDDLSDLSNAVKPNLDSILADETSKNILCANLIILFESVLSNTAEKMIIKLKLINQSEEKELSEVNIELGNKKEMLFKAIFGDNYETGTYTETTKEIETTVAKRVKAKVKALYRTMQSLSKASSAAKKAEDTKQKLQDADKQLVALSRDFRSLQKTAEGSFTSTALTLTTRERELTRLRTQLATLLDQFTNKKQ